MGSKEPDPKALMEPHQLHETETQQGLNQDQAAAAGDDSLEAQGAWTPLLANMCLCTALALGAYICYRACFH